jgi:chromosome segregation ATPase
LLKIIENNGQKFTEFAYNETEMVARLSYFSSRHIHFAHQIDSLNNQIKELVKLNLSESSKAQGYEENLRNLRAQIDDFESQKIKYKSELKKSQDILDAKVLEMEQMERENEATTESYCKNLEKETATRKDLENQLKTLNTKREELLKLKQSLENKVKEYEQMTESKQVLLNDATNQINQLKQEHERILEELDRTKKENEKFKSMLSYIKNFNV